MGTGFSQCPSCYLWYGKPLRWGFFIRSRCAASSNPPSACELRRDPLPCKYMPDTEHTLSARRPVDSSHLYFSSKISYPRCQHRAAHGIGAAGPSQHRPATPSESLVSDSRKPYGADSQSHPQPASNRFSEATPCASCSFPAVLAHEVDWGSVWPPPGPCHRLCPCSWQGCLDTPLLPDYPYSLLKYLRFEKAALLHDCYRKLALSAFKGGRPGHEQEELKWRDEL